MGMPVMALSLLSCFITAKDQTHEQLLDQVAHSQYAVEGQQQGHGEGLAGGVNAVQGSVAECRGPGMGVQGGSLKTPIDRTTRSSTMNTSIFWKLRFYGRQLYTYCHSV